MALGSTTVLERADRLERDCPRLAPIFTAIFEDAAGSPQSVRAAMILDAFENAAELAASDSGPAWLAVVTALEAAIDASPGQTPSVADTLRVKAITLVALNRVGDYLDFAALAAEVGPDRVAPLLALDDLVASTAPSLSTVLVHRLAGASPRICAPPDALEPTVREEPSSAQWAAATSVNAAVAAHLVDDGRSVSSVALTWGPDRMVEAIDNEGIDSWRLLASAVRKDPWGPASQRLTAALDSASDDAGVAAVRAATLLVRKKAGHEEQREVARRVADCVAMSGLAQRAFAARIGTSPSRLSTYVNGSVTPSAAMMLRICKAASALAAQEAADPEP